MSHIKVEIIIPKHEYENWNDFHDGIEIMVDNVKEDISKRLKQDHIRHFEIEVTHEE